MQFWCDDKFLIAIQSVSESKFQDEPPNTKSTVNLTKKYRYKSVSSLVHCMRSCYAGVTRTLSPSCISMKLSRSVGKDRNYLQEGQQNFTSFLKKTSDESGKEVKPAFSRTRSARTLFANSRAEWFQRDCAHLSTATITAVLDIICHLITWFPNSPDLSQIVNASFL